MATVRALVSDPAAAHVETQSTDWLVSGTDPARLTEQISGDESFASVVGEARALPGEYTLVRIGSGRSAPIRAYRGVASSYNLFYCRRPSDGTIVVGDHFRDVLSELPVADRTVPSSAAVDHLLLGTRPTRSYVAEIDRLEHGEVLEWTPGAEPETKLIERIAPDGRSSVSEAQRRLDRHLSDVLDSSVDGPVATMLSGGVDSTLLHTYLDTDATVSGAVDSPEFEFEVDYAETASDLLGADHEFLTFEESEFREQVEATIDAAGHPLMLPQSTLMHLVFSESPYRTYVNGGLADGLFGTGTAALAHLARYLGPARRLLPEVAWELERLKDTAAGLSRSAFDPEGVGMNFRIHADQDAVAAAVGQRAVDEHKRRRLRYTARRVDIDDRAGYAAHMHLGHCLEYFHDNILTIWRHAAHAHGKALATPFGGREMFETALAVPPADRYARFALPPRDRPTQVVQYKYLLKDLLAEQCPDYDTKKRKGHSQLPTQRYFAEGPLADAFDRYEMPEFVPTDRRAVIRNGTDELTWYAFNYAVWRDRVLTNSDLEVFDHTTIVERTVGVGRHVGSAPQHSADEAPKQVAESGESVSIE